MIKAVVLVLTIGFLAGCAGMDTYNSKTLGGVDIPKTAAGICEAFYTVAQVTVEEEPSVARVVALYGGNFPGLLVVDVFGKDGARLRQNLHESGQLPPTIPNFVAEHMWNRGDLITVTCAGRHGERAFNVQRGKADKDRGPTTREAPRALRIPTAGELAIRECQPLLVQLTPFQYKGTKLLGEFFGEKFGPAIGRSLSVEEEMGTGGSHSTHAPLSDIQFRKHVERYAKMFQAENVHYSRSVGESVYAVTATVVKAKFGLARRDGKVWIEDSFFVQIIRNGNPCGVWEAELK